MFLEELTLAFLHFVNLLFFLLLLASIISICWLLHFADCSITLNQQGEEINASKTQDYFLDQGFYT